jgi:hypothetical protein
MAKDFFDDFEAKKIVSQRCCYCNSAPEELTAASCAGSHALLQITIQVRQAQHIVLACSKA